MGCDMHATIEVDEPVMVEAGVFDGVVGGD